VIPEIDTVIIERVTPEIDGGDHPVKRVVGDLLEVQADIFTHGHDVVRAVLLFRRKGEEAWREDEMEHFDNDRWRGAFRLEENATYEYTILAWRDEFLSWAQDLSKKHAAGLEIASELLEGKRLVERVAPRAEESDRKRLEQALSHFDREIGPGPVQDRAVELLDLIEARSKRGEPIAEALAELRQVLGGAADGPQPLSRTRDPVRDVILGPELEALMRCYADRSDHGRFHRVLEVVADRPEARFASWYEMWPRSQGTVPGRSATFADMERRLTEIKALGFNVVYLPPIHPIGRTNRKGPNNSLICPPGSPGCPYAIGNELGGHTAVEPGLGTLEDFRRFERACRGLDMEIALDLALQTSPDHPWVEEHPEWFRRRPDGTIKFAENPPKKYEDIYPLDFATSDKEGLWREVLAVIRFWIDQGVRIFRVDNPHTKPVHFWAWLVEQVHAIDPGVIFLSEAFTRPKMMKALAKAGFNQSYTYFTWRNFKQELTDYFTELTQTEVAEYMRGNLFTNTPDILPKVLQNAPRSAFKMRATLAATLSSLWGMYNGFELCEGTPIPGREEYLDSEKYQYKVWDWDRPGNIKDYLARLNRIRQEHPALQHYRNLRFYHADNENILFYGKALTDAANRDVILVVVNLDPYRVQESFVNVPVEELGLRHDETYQVHELITDRRFFWSGARNYVRLDPEDQPAHVFHLLRWSHREQDFDYFI
jgi:starch synthase (maltosyl-transferring)